MSFINLSNINKNYKVPYKTELLPFYSNYHHEYYNPYLEYYPRFINQGCCNNNNCVIVTLEVPSTITFEFLSSVLSISFTTNTLGTHIYSNFVNGANPGNILNITDTSRIITTQAFNNPPDNIILTFKTFQYNGESFTPPEVVLPPTTVYASNVTLVTGTENTTISIIIVYNYVGTTSTISNIFITPGILTRNLGGVQQLTDCLINLNCIPYIDPTLYTQSNTNIATFDNLVVNRQQYPFDQYGCFQPCCPRNIIKYPEISLCVPNTSTFTGNVDTISISFSNNLEDTLISYTGTNNILTINSSEYIITSRFFKEIPESITLSFNTFQYNNQSYTSSVITLENSETSTTIDTVVTSAEGSSITIIVIYVYNALNWIISELLYIPN